MERGVSVSHRRKKLFCFIMQEFATVVSSVEEATQTFLDEWQKYGDKRDVLSMKAGHVNFRLSRQGDKVLVQSGAPSQNQLVSDSDLPEAVVRLLEGVRFPDYVHVRYGRRAGPEVPTNMHAVMLRAPAHATRATSQVWKPYLNYARRVKLHTMDSIGPNNTNLNVLRKHMESDDSTCDRWVLVDDKNEAVVGHAAVVEPDAPGEDMTLERLFVDPNQRRRGGGSVLLRAVEKQARDLQAKGICIDSSVDGIRFYGNQGYRNRGYSQFYKRAQNFR